jgi:hypothetical protein
MDSKNNDDKTGGTEVKTKLAGRIVLITLGVRSQPKKAPKILPKRKMIRVVTIPSPKVQGRAERIMVATDVG